MDTVTKAKTTQKAPKKVTSVRLDTKLYDRAKRHAEAEKRSLSQYLEMALERYVDEADLKQRQDVAEHVQPGDTHGLWSAYDEPKAAEQLQALLESLRS